MNQATRSVNNTNTISEATNNLNKPKMPDAFRDFALIGQGIPFSLEKMINYSSKGSNPKGYEPLSEDNIVPISWKRNESNRLDEEDFRCLVQYYQRQYQTPISLHNKVKKFKKVKLLGHKYSSIMNGRENDTNFNAYRPFDFENDDLEGVRITDYEENLRAGRIEYFFCHQAEFIGTDGQTCFLDHYFAFVRWYKIPPQDMYTLSQYIGPYIRPYFKEFEEKGSYCILPIQKLLTPVHTMSTPFIDVIVILDLTK